ncbi:MarR family transcriptional regulator [Bacillus luteus]|uniref:MarR family transcriptional regulator n=2 Tax=Alkalicoccus luteus TaxID=1237094 RepID=A0A969PQ64_9BACI|nr:MarR family transcriptional regulator [Alkalicoccus luteus]
MEPAACLKAVAVLVKAHDSVHACIKRDAANAGLNPTEFSVMELLLHKGTLPTQEIGRRVLISSGSITYVVDKLEAKKLVRRTPCPTDRRITFTELTESGRTLIDDAFFRHRKNVENLFAEVEADQLETMISTLKQIGRKAEG